MVYIRSIIYHYQPAIVNIAVSCSIFEIFDVEEYRDLEIYKLESLKVTGNGTIRWIAYEFLFIFHCRPSYITVNSDDKTRYWSKLAIFFIRLST